MQVTPVRRKNPWKSGFSFCSHGQIDSTGPLARQNTAWTHCRSQAFASFAGQSLATRQPQHAGARQRQPGGDEKEAAEWREVAQRTSRGDGAGVEGAAKQDAANCEARRSECRPEARRAAIGDAPD